MPAALNKMADRRSAAADFCNKIGTFRTWSRARLEFAMHTKADVDRPLQVSGLTP